MIEPIDKQYLKKRFPETSNGYIWKCSYPADINYKKIKSDSIGIEKIDPENDKLSVRPIYDLKTKKKEFAVAKSKLIKFLKNIERLKGKQFEKWIEKAFAVKLFLKTMAVDVVVGMWDGFWYNKNNFYLYFVKKTNKVYFISHDYDLTLGTGYWEDFAKAKIFRFQRKGREEDRPLIDKILSIKKYKDFYIRYIESLLSNKKNLFYSTSSIKRIIKWHKLIAPYIHNSTGERCKIIDQSPDRKYHSKKKKGFFHCLIRSEFTKKSRRRNYFVERNKFLNNLLNSTNH